ncbi:unnamed protein product, partial [Symbiodinium pilosum]
MPETKVAHNVVSYNAVLDAVHGRAQAADLFRKARKSGHFTDLCKKGPTYLDLHDMSAGAAWTAVEWWFAEVLPTVFQQSKPRTCVIITGWGKSRELWQRSDNQSFIMAKL